MNVFFHGKIGMGAVTHLRNLLLGSPPGVNYFFDPNLSRNPRLDLSGLPGNYTEAFSFSISGAYLKLPFVMGYYRRKKRDFPSLNFARVRKPEIDLTYAWLRPIVHDKPWVLAFDYPPGAVATEYPYSNLAVKVLEKTFNSKNCKKLLPFSEWAIGKVLESVKLPAEKVEVVPPPPIKSVRPIKRKSESVRILFVGMWFKAKGGYLLLDAFRELKREYDDISLEIAGPSFPEPYTEIKRRIGNDSGVKLHSFLPQEEVFRLYQNSDILCVPSYHEAFGQVYTEAMNFSLPVVANRVNAIPEIVEDGVTGLLTKPFDKRGLVESLRLLIESGSLRRRMGRKGKERFERLFSKRVVNKKLLRIYREALEG